MKNNHDRNLVVLACTLSLAIVSLSPAALTLKDATPSPLDFPLVANKRAATIVVDQAEAEVVRTAAGMLVEDVERVTGVKPQVVASVAHVTEPLVILGAVGKSALISDLAKRGKLDTRAIEGKWESFLVQTVVDPWPGVPSALVIAGSDRRGAAYGAVTVSEAIGVSPWVWWADVVPEHRAALVLSGSVMQGPPSVKYRGIFINDEDWGLHPWAGKTFEPEAGDIGPRTYAKVFELLLRLKANYCWPAMHECTKAFNSFPENKLVADRYAIVMGSSHCEMMLRNNTREWPRDQKDKWNPVTNLPAILDYWDQRVRENGKYENVYTVGMRGVHDSGMPGGGTLPEKRDRMQKIIELQRGMLAKHVNPDPGQVPQIFCPYKEVLDIYQTGMKVPNDITLVWPDDNYGYIRQLSNVDERKRSGGSGIYYHLSYLGRPHDYLWLDSTAPALVWNEMTKAYALGARQVWVVNVGDLKSIETGMTLFLELAWDINRYGPDVQKTFLHDFYARQFGDKFADRITVLRDEYYRLCAIRKPEHMGYNRAYFSKKTPVTPGSKSEWSSEEPQQILGRWQAVAKGAAAIAGELPSELHDAYFQLVEYPLCAGAAHAEKILLAEQARLTGSAEAATRAKAAYDRVQQFTEQYNALGGGKWRGIMDAHPCKRPVFKMPPTTPDPATPAAIAAAALDGQTVIDPVKFTRVDDRNGAGWRVIEGLGPRGAAIAVLPPRDTPTLRTPQEIRAQAPVAEYEIQRPKADEVEVTLEALPTHPFTPGHEVLAAVSIGDGEPVVVRFDQGRDDEKDPTWQRNVLRGAITGSVKLKVPAASNVLKLWAVDPSVVVQRVSLDTAVGK